ncbi:MAG: 2-dehydropantoate 2-reductase [Candidatus Woesearchaeota archaeon]|nr:2-dehydropantoate 2-reductase [Candidatus Woesearchaeota archaeon]MDP6265842.1 2-dehydropantoate 2-reductase [Candidatus Woesearchaeota archaeon]MDP7322884.1 2-dehydropantoate 2-reductase [Candidatus Woesearchaeota archaeon]
MNIIVLGAGAIGSLYGAKLSKLNDVTLVARQKHINKINNDGLKIVGIEENVYKLKATAKIENIENNTLILLTTKVHDNKKAIDPIKDLIKKDTIILCMQNGLYSENIVKSIVGDRCLVLRGITNVGATFLEPGKVQFSNLSSTKIENSNISEELAENFDKCGLKCSVSENIKQDIWKKLILNCVLNPVSAILRVENGKIADERLNTLKKSIVDECLKVAEKDDVRFDIDFVKIINDAIKDSRNLSSMHQDVLKGKKTEIDYLNGAVVELGKKYGIKCPVNEALVVIVKGMGKQ